MLRSIVFYIASFILLCGVFWYGDKSLEELMTIFNEDITIDNIMSYNSGNSNPNSGSSQSKPSSSASSDKYDRTEYEKPVQSYWLNGSKTNRNDYAWKTSPYLKSDNPFEYTCPYTGQTITDESKLDYDHIIPLKYVDEHTDWDKEKKNDYAYDQSIGVDVLYSANRSKGDKGPSKWLPDINQKEYCYTWLQIAEEWDIQLAQEDIDVINKIIGSDKGLERID